MSVSNDRELNLVPYMDIVTTLIIAMIVMSASTMDLSAAKVKAPPVGVGTGPALSVAIGAAGFDVYEGDAVRALPRTDGAWPMAALSATLRELRSAGEASDTLTVRAEPQVPVSVLVATMDAARSDAQGPLYPAVALAVAR
jgi:biopolymer transport protein ExbD